MVLTIATTLAGLTILAGGAWAIWSTSRRVRPAVQQCVRCRHSWTSVEKFCPRCDGKGRLATRGLIPPHRVPTHDWQGYLDTVEIPVVKP